MGADYSFEVKNIEIFVTAFFKHNNSFVATVMYLYLWYSMYVSIQRFGQKFKDKKVHKMQLYNWGEIASIPPMAKDYVTPITPMRYVQLYNRIQQPIPKLRDWVFTNFTANQIGFWREKNSNK